MSVVRTGPKEYASACGRYSVKWHYAPRGWQVAGPGVARRFLSFVAVLEFLRGLA